MDDIIDIEFVGDLCETCIHADYCVLIKSIQVGYLEPQNEMPIKYCCFYQGRSIANIVSLFLDRFKKPA